MIRPTDENGKCGLKARVAASRSTGKMPSMDELEIIAQPNDAYFKQVFSNPQRATLFFQTHLPAEIVALIDWASLKTEAASFVKQTLQQTHSDLLYTVKMDGRELKLYLLFEHQTTVDQTMPLRVLSYVLEILQAHLKNEGLPLPPVLPFILHQGPDRWTASPCFEDLFALTRDTAGLLLPYLPKFQHALLDLTQRDPDKDEFHDSLRLVFQLMKLARQKKLADFLHWIAAEMSRPDWEVEEALMLLSYLYTMCVDATIDEAQIAHSLEQKPNLKEKHHVTR
jgi:predicted transposase YdaD